MCVYVRVCLCVFGMLPVCTCVCAVRARDAWSRQLKRHQRPAVGRRRAAGRTGRGPLPRSRCRGRSRTPSTPLRGPRSSPVAPSTSALTRLRRAASMVEVRRSSVLWIHECAFTTVRALHARRRGGRRCRRPRCPRDRRGHRGAAVARTGERRRPRDPACAFVTRGCAAAAHRSTPLQRCQRWRQRRCGGARALCCVRACVRVGGLSRTLTHTRARGGNVGARKTGGIAKAVRSSCVPRERAPA